MLDLAGQAYLVSDRAHRGDRLSDQLADLDLEHLGATSDHLTVDARGKAFVLPLLPYALRLHIEHTPRRPHERCRGNEPGELIGRVEDLFHSVFGLHVGHESPRVAHDASDVVLRPSRLAK